jgi:hypothetical protein
MALWDERYERLEKCGFAVGVLTEWAALRRNFDKVGVVARRGGGWNFDVNIGRVA